MQFYSCTMSDYGKQPYFLSVEQSPLDSHRTECLVLTVDYLDRKGGTTVLIDCKYQYCKYYSTSTSSTVSRRKNSRVRFSSPPSTPSSGLYPITNWPPGPSGPS
jgi:hypothetical protein